MKPSKTTILALDIGDRRIGVALGDSSVRFAAPLTTLIVDGTEIIRLQTLLLEHDVRQLVVGLPRNLSGEETKQTQAIRQFVDLRLAGFKLPIIYQDESVTSVMAEAHLRQTKKNYKKADIDAYAATIILQDYLETLHG